MGDAYSEVNKIFWRGIGEQARRSNEDPEVEEYKEVVFRGYPVEKIGDAHVYFYDGVFYLIDGKEFGKIKGKFDPELNLREIFKEGIEEINSRYHSVE